MQEPTELNLGTGEGIDYMSGSQHITRERMEMLAKESNEQFFDRLSATDLGAHVKFYIRLAEDLAGVERRAKLQRLTDADMDRLIAEAFDACLDWIGYPPWVYTDVDAARSRDRREDTTMTEPEFRASLPRTSVGAAIKAGVYAAALIDLAKLCAESGRDYCTSPAAARREARAMAEAREEIRLRREPQVADPFAAELQPIEVTMREPAMRAVPMQVGRRGVRFGGVTFENITLGPQPATEEPAPGRADNF